MCVECKNMEVGRYRACCVAKGFRSISGKDFQENHAPVIVDTTLHLIMVIKTLFKLETGQFDIETAFLYVKLKGLMDGNPRRIFQLSSREIC
jgi:hypothetical protein